MEDVTYEVKPMDSWSDVNADLVITDPPFGIEFSGKEETYNRDESNVVDGYVEWDVSKYTNKINTVIDVINRNIASDGQALVFSGWNNSHIIQKCIIESSLTLEGKLYWAYNFAPYCSRRPAHNIYEIFWITTNKRHYYDNTCSYDHCTDGEANLSLLDIPRDYHKDIPKYPTRLPEEVVGVLLEHFSEEEDEIFDPMAGSGMVGYVSSKKNRSAVLGDLNSGGKDVFQSIVEQNP